jgi:hypothetical protein
MSTILLTEQQDTRYVRPRPILTLDRLRARVCSSRLDRALANGAPPDASADLSLHAHRLIGPRIRRELARELRALPREAARSRHPMNPQVPICRREVLEAGDLLEQLADRLADADPVDPCGVAQVLVLLRDGDSPLFHPSRARELERTVEAALSALEPVVPD